jgi:polyhydroxyalkanoate synthase
VSGDHDIPGADTARQMLTFSRKLARGVAGLRAADRGREGATPHDTVLRRGPLRLLRYTPEVPEPEAPPLLIVYALVNRPYILDLQPGRSFVAGLLAGGRTVYLLDWGYPGTDESTRGLAEHVITELDAVIDRVLGRHRVPALDLLGVCQGGTLSLCRAALRPGSVRRLVLTVTPVDFDCPDFLLARWLRHVDVPAMVERLGNVPGGLLNWAFLALKPFTLSSMKAREFIELMDSPEGLATFMAMEQWIQDSPDQGARVFLEFVQAFFRDNALLTGALTLGGEAVDVSTLRCPVLSIHAESDHIVPPTATTALASLLPHAPYTGQSFPGGHIGLFAGSRGARLVPAYINRWLDGPGLPEP